MTKTTRFLSQTLAAVAFLAMAANARAQVSGLEIKAPNNPKLSIQSGDVATVAFGVRNSATDTALVEPRIIAPKGWRVVMTPVATVLAPAQQEVWLISVKSPASAMAGEYTIRVEGVQPRIAAGGPSATVSATDSVVVSIAERRGVSVSAINSLSYIMSGQGYEGRFVLRNLGNVPARFEIAAKSTHGNTPLLAREVFALAAGASDTVIANVVIPGTVATTVEEVLLISAVDVTSDSVRAEATLQATVVPRANAGPMMWTVPAEIAFRTAAPGTGVSMFAASGTGKLTQTSGVNVDFLLRGPTGKGASFGDQETYRVALSSKLGRVRLGDHSFGFSQLLTSGTRSTGAEVRSRWKGLVGGAYLHRDRTNGSAPTEASAMIGTDETKPVSGSVIALTRSGSTSAANVITTAGKASYRGVDLDVELAASDSLDVAGQAGSVRLSGATTFGTYDLSAQHASAGFASIVQGATDLRASLIGRKMGSMILMASANSHVTNPLARPDGSAQRLALAAVGASWTNGLSAEVEHLDREDVGYATATVGTMETLRLRGRRSIGMFEGSLNLTTGLAAERDSSTRSSMTLGGSVTAHIGEREYVSLFADYMSGRGLGESGIPSTTAGLNTELRIRETTVRVMNTLVMQSAAAARTATNTDLMMEREVRNTTLGLRARLSTVSRGPASHALFFEVKRRLGLPTAPMNEIGRARIAILDGETGKGVAGALVRVGGQAAVTDANGVAVFRDLAAGQYRAVIDGAAVAGRVVASGGTVAISATSRKPAQVAMTLSRGARIVAVVRSFERASALAGNGDTLTEVGAVGQVTVALVTANDTLWQTSDERGRVDFGSVAPGRYTVAIPRYEAPDRMALAQTAFEFEVGAGDTRQVDFKLIPQVRAIEFVGEAILIAAPAKSADKPAAAGTTTITGKPQTTPITSKPDEPVTAKPQSPSKQKQQSPTRNERQENR